MSNDDLTTQRLSTYSMTLYAYSSTVGSSVYSFDSRQTRKPGFRKSAVGFHTVVDSCPPVSWNPLGICFLSVAMRHVRCEKCIRYEREHFQCRKRCDPISDETIGKPLYYHRCIGVFQWFRLLRSRLYCCVYDGQSWLCHAAHASLIFVGRNSPIESRFMNCTANLYCVLRRLS